jgi:PIN domain nuclease of toxin-antitoxin system
VNLLLDTQVALWAITASPRLSTKAQDLILDPTATIWISVASLWEIVIKHAIGRGDMPVSGGDAMRYFEESGYRRLPVDARHVLAVADLPAHHDDPFDRILIAQAKTHPMRLLTQDPHILQYGENMIGV